MRRDRKYRYGMRPYRPWRSFHNAFWLIGLAILFFWGHWWPGILILVGLSILLEGFFRGTAQSWGQNPPPPPVDPNPHADVSHVNSNSARAHSGLHPSC